MVHRTYLRHCFQVLWAIGLAISTAVPPAKAQWLIELWTDQMDCAKTPNVAADATRGGSSGESNNCMMITDTEDDPYTAMRVTNWTSDCAIAFWSNDSGNVPCASDMPYNVFNNQAPDVVFTTESHSVESLLEDHVSYHCVPNIGLYTKETLGYMAYSCDGNSTLLTAEDEGDSPEEIHSLLQLLSSSLLATTAAPTTTPKPSFTTTATKKTGDAWLSEELQLLSSSLLLKTASPTATGKKVLTATESFDHDRTSSDEGQRAVSFTKSGTFLFSNKSGLPTTVISGAEKTSSTIETAVSTLASSTATAAAAEPVSKTSSSSAKTPTETNTSTGTVSQGYKTCYSNTLRTLNRDITHDKIVDLCNARIADIKKGQLTAVLGGVPAYLSGEPLNGWDVFVEVVSFEPACMPGSTMQSEHGNILPDLCTSRFMSVIDGCPPFNDANMSKAGGIIYGNCLSWRLYLGPIE